jgi:hypothetical protein
VAAHVGELVGEDGLELLDGQAGEGGRGQEDRGAEPAHHRRYLDHRRFQEAHGPAQPHPARELGEADRHGGVGERLRGAVHGEFLASPGSTIERLAQSLGLDWDRPLGPTLPLSKTTVSQPKPDKWRTIEAVIKGLMPLVEKADSKARAFIERLKP